MDDGPDLSEDLCAGRRALSRVPELEIAEDWRWYDSVEKWVLRCRLFPQVNPRGMVPRTTEWYVLVERSYPWGALRFYPAKTGGLEGTFPHQMYNATGEASVPWRTGFICLATSVANLGRPGLDIEPFTATDRMRWHAARALSWLVDASNDALQRPGDPFELPALPGRRSGRTVAFSEGPESFATWAGRSERAGYVDLHVRQGRLVFIERFCSRRGDTLVAPLWGDWVRGGWSTPAQRGVWIHLNSTPVLTPWQAPATWGELRSACRRQGLHLDQLLERVTGGIRDSVSHLLLVGFPIPFRVGQPAARVHWLAIELPILSSGKSTIPGFRGNKAGRRMRDRTEVLRASNPLVWITTENWHPEQLAARGRFSDVVTGKHFALLGAGALGSVVAEMLVRAGVRHLVVVDEATLEAGNLARHTLTLDDAGACKATALAKRLNALSPHACVQGIGASYPDLTDADMERVAACDIVIDCTASDEVLFYLSNPPWSDSKTFACASLGYGARRLFCYTASGRCFPLEGFRAAIGPWLLREAGEHAGEEFPREGIGCWHPVFPARIDRVAAMAAALAQRIESVVLQPPPVAELAVFDLSDDELGWEAFGRGENALARV